MGFLRLVVGSHRCCATQKSSRHVGDGADARPFSLGGCELDGGRCVLAQLPSALPHVGAGRAHAVRGALAVFISRGRGN